MATNENMNAICSQLLTQKDLSVTAEFFKHVQDEKIVTNIIQDENSRSIKVYSTEKIYLSTITPILHDFKFVIIDEVTYNIAQGKDTIYISRFNLDIENTGQLVCAKENIESVITDSLRGKIKSCKLFYLVSSQNLSVRSIMLMNAIIEYIDQAVISLNSDAILSTLVSHDKLSSLFVAYFETKFDPSMDKREEKLAKLDEKIHEKIKQVPNIMDDKILKLTYGLLKALLRTNFFMGKDTISFKINTKEFSKFLTGLQPNIESFVYHPDFYGIHLRMTKISRGGLRWSDRHEDYRQEIKSLMITQEGKNSIIIPSGAKGGLVINRPNSEITKEFFKEIYSEFIDNLLDLVDNVFQGKVIRNEKIVRYDSDDTYFVVAADKGTANMSDVANNLAINRGYWLGDAFASGGSNGYGHKKLGITARGSIMSTKRFFIEEGIDIEITPITIVGIGSMNGDVFGNGLLESEQFKLLAAIGHKEIFIDPNPDPETSFKERKRLFASDNGSWENYNKELISTGGGVFLRSEKNIDLTPEMKKILGTTKKSLSGEELCKKILTMKVDMLFNGGVGTYVKSSEESNLNLGDKQNEAVRVDASELKARIVCEGGNLGFTQKARIEFAMAGGKINLDGIDNAAGVNTSDHEVNLKILLNNMKQKGILSEDEANTTLHDLTNQVVNLVLWNNYQQALAISKDEMLSKKYLENFIHAIEILEQNVETFKRVDFFIPKNENIDEIINKNGYIVRPILASLLSYSKIFVKKILLSSKLIDEAFCLQYLYKYFPKSFVSAYEHEISQHPLKREIIATKIADIVINSQGITFVSNFDKLGIDTFLLKIKSYLITSQLLSTKEIKFDIYKHDYKMPIKTQYELLDKLEHSVNFSIRWMVKYLSNNIVDASHILDHKEELFSLLSQIQTKPYEEIIKGNEKFNRFFSVIEYLRFVIAVIMIKENSHHSFKDVMIIFYSVVHEFKILELISSLNKISIVTPSEHMLRSQVLQFIEYTIVHYTKNVLEFQRVNESPEVAFDNFIKNEKDIFDNIQIVISNFMNDESQDLQKIAITVNQLMVSII